MHLQPGTLLQGGKYKIVRFIAAGGFGCTYEATHTILNARVAIKEFFVSDLCNRDSATGHVSVGITSKVALFDKLRRKFVDEAAALFKLNHPGLVRVTDIFEENGTAYFVMDYIDGRSLAEIVKAEGPMSEARALGYIRQVCDALNYVHSNNRLHLDIKPNNIMVTGNDRAILIDFGASKQYDEASGENTSSLLGLTPGYAPPEQNDCDVKKFYPATDIYALGATLYDLLTGTTPPSSNKRISEEEELQPLPPTISASTRTAVYTALELSKKKRPQSVAAFAALLDNTPAPAPPEDNGETQLLVDKPVTPWYKHYGVMSISIIMGYFATFIVDDWTTGNGQVGTVWIAIIVTAFCTEALANRLLFKASLVPWYKRIGKTVLLLYTIGVIARLELEYMGFEYNLDHRWIWHFGLIIVMVETSIVYIKALEAFFVRRT